MVFLTILRTIKREDPLILRCLNIGVEETKYLGKLIAAHMHGQLLNHVDAAVLECSFHRAIEILSGCRHVSVLNERGGGCKL